MDTKGDGSSWEPGADMKTPWMKQTAKEGLLHGAGSSAQRSAGIGTGRSPKPMDGWFIFLHRGNYHTIAKHLLQ